MFEASNQTRLSGGPSGGPGGARGRSSEWRSDWLIDQIGQIMNQPDPLMNRFLNPAAINHPTNRSEARAEAVATIEYRIISR